MRQKLSDLFTAAELQLTQISIAKASTGCAIFFSADKARTISCPSGAVGRRVSLCCFTPELSLLCGQNAFEQAQVSEDPISDMHKCRCGAFYYWVNFSIQNQVIGYCHIRTTEVLPRNSSHIAMSYVRTLAVIGSIRMARKRLKARKKSAYVSFDPHQLYGHPNFLSLIRMIGEAGCSLLDANRCLFLACDSSNKLLTGEYASDLSPEQIASLQVSVEDFPAARKALEMQSHVIAEKGAAGSEVPERLRAAIGEERFVVVPLLMGEHARGLLVFMGAKVTAGELNGPLTLAEFASATASFLAVLGYRIEAVGSSDEPPAQVGIIQRYAAMGQMAAEIGHDIQASLYGMKNYAYLLSNSVRDDVPKATYTRAISDGITYIERLSTEMRKLTGEPRQITLGPTDLGHVIDSAVLLLSPMAAERGITIVKEVAENLPVLQADPVALTEVFLNLGLNAIHSMKDAGQIRIAVKPQEEKVFITVQDTGSGITPEILERFWNNSSYAAKSFTNKGLYIVRRIIRQLKGTIEIETKTGLGTSFFIELWIDPSASAPKTEAERRIPVSFSPLAPGAPGKTALT